MDLTPRRIRPVPPQLSLYLRPGRQDHRALLEFLSEGTPAALGGVVFDPCLTPRQDELRREVLERGIEAVVDTRSMELATIGGFQGPAAKLPWAGNEAHSPESLSGSEGRVFVDKLVSWIATRGFTRVLAPTHLLADLSDPWLEVDKQLTFQLRESLDNAGLSNVLIYYPLSVPGEVFYGRKSREALRFALSNLPIDVLWLRIQPFGSRSGARVLRRYIEACHDFHGSPQPLIAEKTGTIGLALLAFGAVGSIESGLTIGEHFDAGGLTRERKPGKGFGPHSRVYLPELQSFLTRKRAAFFFENGGMRSHFACRDSNCCRRGSVDMLDNPRRHFLKRRLREVARLSQLPEVIRPGRYMEEILRPATDKLIRAAKVEPTLQTNRQRLDAWRFTLGAMLENAPPTSFSSVPEGRRIRALRGA